MQAKTQTIAIRIDADERALLETLAATWGSTLSATIRRLIREALVSRKAI